MWKPCPSAFLQVIPNLAIEQRMEPRSQTSPWARTRSGVS